MGTLRWPQLSSGLYVILDPLVRPDRPLSDVLTTAAEGGAHIFQYRNKLAPMKDAFAEALPLRKQAHELGVIFIVNDRCDLAMAIDADGVHLGQSDLPYAEARKLLGLSKLIGLSTHNPIQVRAADQLQPDYIGFGPIFKPTSKPEHDPVVGIEGLTMIRPLTSLPVFAIGGIGTEQVEAVMHAGANGVAVMSAALKASDVTKAVKELIARMPRPILPGS
jgi:thiamine-phosphate pyrophosphorylase